MLRLLGAKKSVKNETVVGAVMVFLGIVIMLIALTLGVVLPAATLRDVQADVLLDGIFLTPPFFTIGGMVLIILGKMHSESETRKGLAVP
jgi:hypothetical protein